MKRIVLASLFALLAAGVPAWPAGEEVVVRLQLLATPHADSPEGESVYGPTEQKASGDVRLGFDETGYVYLGTGSFDDRGAPVTKRARSLDR